MLSSLPSRNPTPDAAARQPSGARAAGTLASAVMLLACFVAGPAAAATPVANAADGQAMAERWCSSCHVVNGATATRAQSDVPSFASIAAARGEELTPSWLAFRLLKPHPQMPSIDLSRQQAQDLAAYFASLRK